MKENENQIAQINNWSVVYRFLGNVTKLVKKRKNKRKTYVFLLFIERIKIKVNLINFLCYFRDGGGVCTFGRHQRLPLCCISHLHWSENRWITHAHTYTLTDPIRFSE